MTTDFDCNVATPLAGGLHRSDWLCAKTTETGASSKAVAWRSSFLVVGRVMGIRDLGTAATAAVAAAVATMMTMRKRPNSNWTKQLPMR